MWSQVILLRLGSAAFTVSTTQDGKGLLRRTGSLPYAHCQDTIDAVAVHVNNFEPMMPAVDTSAMRFLIGASSIRFP